MRCIRSGCGQGEYREKMNIVEKVFQRADRGAIALISENASLTYGALYDLVKSLAAQLEASGAMKTAGVPRIGLSCPDGVSYIVFALAVVRAGGCLVPVAGELPPQERDVLADSTGLHALIIAPGGDWNHRFSGSAAEIGAGGFHATVLFGLMDSHDGKFAFDENELSALNPAFIRFSSGTTGRSKGIVLSHQSLDERIASANRALQICPADRIVWMLPMAHHFAVSIMLYLMHGATTVIAASHFPEDILSLARAHGGTVVYASPFHHALLAAEPSGLPWPALRLAVSTAAGLPPATAKAFDARYGVPLSQALGIIEVGLPLINVDAPRQKPDSVGRPLPDFSIALRDENGAAVPSGEQGELFLRGPGMLDAYLSPWQSRREILQDGWFRTGDLATLDNEGYVRLAGRSRSVINVAGMKCFPEEIEAVLCCHPGIRAARVVAKPHPKFGSVPAAELVARDGLNPPAEAAIVKHCKNSLARYKVPVEFRFVRSLPLTPSGKIKR